MNASSDASSHPQDVCFICCLSGWTIVAKFRGKALAKACHPNERAQLCFTCVSGGFLYRFFTFFGSGFIPSLLNTSPTKRSSFTSKTHLFGFTVNLLLPNADKTFSIATSCCSTGPPMRISSAMLTWFEMPDSILCISNWRMSSADFVP